MKKFSFLFVAIMLVTCIGSMNVSAATHKTQSGLEKDTVDTVLEDTEEFASYWEPKCGVPASSHGKIAEDGEGKYIDINGVYSFLSYDEITSPSEFTIDLRAKKLSTNIGISFRAGNVFNLYEWDFHTEKGGQDGLSSIGATGIILTPIEGGLRVIIKTQDDNSTWGISSVFHDFMIEGIDYSKFVPIRIKDDGKTAQILVNNKLLATVDMANEGEYESDYDTEIFEYLDFVYYKTVSVKDAQGNEVIKTDKARIVSEQFFAGAAVREAQADFKNIELSYTTSSGTADETTATPGEPTTKPTDAVTTAKSTPKATPKSYTVPPVPDADMKSENGNTMGMVIGISAGVVVIGIVLIVIFVVRKKRK